MTFPLTLTTGRRPDGSALLTLAGEIDMSNAETLAGALRDNPGQVTVDLTAVEYLDSAGLAVLFANAARVELVVSDLLTPVLAVSGLADVTTVHVR